MNEADEEKEEKDHPYSLLACLFLCKRLVNLFLHAFARTPLILPWLLLSFPRFSHSSYTSHRPSGLHFLDVHANALEIENP